MYTFSGQAYQGLQAERCSGAAIEYMQANLRIIDPLYGILRPLDMMQPYRLEMATKYIFEDKTIKLADWWRDSITAGLCKDLEDRTNKIVLNLASDEYSAAVDPKGLPKGTHYIKIVFWEEGRTIAIHAKKARGTMVRFVAENNIQDIAGVQSFAEEGYCCVLEKSDKSQIIFDRKVQGPVKKKVMMKVTSSDPVKKKVRSK